MKELGVKVLLAFLHAEGLGLTPRCQEGICESGCQSINYQFLVL